MENSIEEVQKEVVINSAPETPVKKTKKKSVKKTVKKEIPKVDALTIEKVMELYKEAHINCINPDAKSPYRIMGTSKRKGGSSLNIKKSEYVIFSTDEDYQNIVDANIQADDLVLEKDTNSRDSTRPNKVTFKTVETLKKLLPIYAKNTMYQVVTK